MDVWLGISIGVFATLLVVFLLARFARRAVTGADPTQLTFDAALMREVQALVASGRKIQAIAMLREKSPELSLMSAKTLVDRMEAQLNRPRAGSAGSVPSAGSVGSVGSPPGAGSVPSAAPVPLEVELEARGLVAQGEVITAVKVVRQHTGWGLQESKEYVDGLVGERN